MSNNNGHTETPHTVPAKERAWQKAWEVATNSVPPLMAIYVLAHSVLDQFKFAFWAAVVGAGATTLAVVLHMMTSMTPGSTTASKAMQPSISKMSWIFMAYVLLVNAVDGMNLAYYSGGIKALTDTAYENSKISALRLTFVDTLSVAIGLVMVVAPSLCPWFAPARGGGADERKHLRRVVQTRHLPALGLVALLLALLLFGTSKPTPIVGPQPNVRDVDASNAIASSIGILFFIIGYLGNHRTVFGLARFRNRKAVRAGQPPPIPGNAIHTDSERGQQNRTSWDEVDELLWRQDLHKLVFESVVLPPIVVSIALVGGALDQTSVVVYGLFVYSGFSVWNLSMKVASGHVCKPFGIAAAILQIAYSFLMSVLWITLLWELGNCVHNPIAFRGVLGVTLAAIFVQIVFGPVYRNVWSGTLRDRWILDGAEYVVITTVICAGLAAIPQQPYKPWIVGLVISLCIFLPARFMRRRLTAYVLLRVKPGRTEDVRKKLLASELNSAVIYGDYDLLVKVEVPGPFILRAGRTPDPQTLLDLANLVKNEIRLEQHGVIETQTLLDFTDFVPLDSQLNVSQKN